MTCRHDWRRSGASLAFKVVLDHWLGPTAGLCRCSQCGDYAVAYLTRWSGKNLERRTFAIREVAADAADTWLHNVSREYCDLTRKSAETDALIASSSSEAWLVSVSMPDLEVLGAEGPTRAPAHRPWQELAAS